GRAEKLEGRRDTAGAVRNAGAVEAHLDPAQRAAQHQIVEMAEMADAEDPALHLAEPGAERHVETVEDDVAHPVGVKAVGHQDRGQRTRIFPRVRAQYLEPPAGDGAPGRLGMTRMTAEHRR